MRDPWTLSPLFTWLYQKCFTEKDFFFKLQTSICEVNFFGCNNIAETCNITNFLAFASFAKLCFLWPIFFFWFLQLLARQTQTFVSITGFFNFWLQNFCENIKFQNFQPRFTLQCQIDRPRRLVRGLIGVLMDSPWMTCVFQHRHYCHLFS